MTECSEPPLFFQWLLGAGLTAGLVLLVLMVVAIIKEEFFDE